MNQLLVEKIKESLAAVLPVTGVVLLLSMTITPMPLSTMAMFLAGAVMLIVGMGLFTLGADMAMMPIGEKVGVQLTRTTKLWLIAISCFVIGVIITVAEPDLAVLARQTPGVPDMVLILCVAVGVGLFLVLAFLRSLFSWNLNRILIACYIVVFVLAFFVPRKFLAVAFDSGGVTTGPITVPFIMALGVGVATVGKSEKAGEENNFGLIALCSVGPILSVLLLGMVYGSSGGNYTPLTIPEVVTTRDLWLQFRPGFADYGHEVLVALLPIIVFFVIFQLFFLKMRRNALVRILVGIVYTFLGLTLFLAGVNIGFMPAGYTLGMQLAGLKFNWILVPLGMLIGYFIVKAEPAVAVLNKQVEDITEGVISQKVMMMGLSIGMACSVGLAMLRVLTGVNILWILVPGYAIALGLAYVVPRIFTAVAFDSGGVASGPMTATFLLPFAMGACDAVGGDILSDAFGIVAMVSMTPLIIIQLIGLVYRIRTAHNERVNVVVEEEEIIDLTIKEETAA